MVLDAAARWAVGTSDDPLPEEVVHHAKRAILDFAAALVAGADMPPARILTDALVEAPSTGRATLFPRGERTDLRTAALINATAAHTAEVDDIFRDGVYHPGAPTIAAALAAAQDRGATGAELIRAVVVGYEIGTRISAVIQPAHYRFWHTTGTVGTMGAAAAVACLLDADEEQFVHAVATATSLASGLQQAFRSDAMTKPLHAGHAAEAGSLSAMAAVRGYTGVPTMLEGEVGFGAAMSDEPEWDGVFDDLGDRWNTTAMTFKNHVCCGHTFAAIDGVLELADRVGDPGRVERIEVATYRTAVEVTGNPEPTTTFEAQFSLPYTVAAALVFGSVRLAAFTPEALEDPVVRDLVDRVVLSVDDRIDAAFPTRRGARVRIELTDGTVHESLRPTRVGDPDLPLDDAGLTAKFRELADGPLGPAAAERMAESVWSLERQQDLDALLPAALEVGR